MRLVLVLLLQFVIASAAVAQPARQALATGRTHSLAIASDGRIWSFGEGDSGRLGRDTTESDNEPDLADTPFGMRFVAVGAGNEHSLAIDVSGRLWSWGGNPEGALGHHEYEVSSVPTPALIPVHGTSAEGIVFTQVVGGRDFSLAIDATRRLWGWGAVRGRGRSYNRGDDGHVLKPVEFPETVRVTSVSAGSHHAAAVDTEGRVWTWGNNVSGELGIGPANENGVFEYSLVPLEVSHPSGVRFTSVATSYGFTVATDENGIAWAWGEQSLGQLGTGQPEDSPTPTRVAMPYGTRFVDVVSGDKHAIALDEDGRAWAWGWGSFSQLGTGAMEPQTTPMRVAMPDDVRFLVVAAGFAHNLALDNTGRVWAWGRNYDGELGLPLEVSAAPTPTLVGAF